MTTRVRGEQPEEKDLKMEVVKVDQEPQEPPAKEIFVLSWGGDNFRDFGPHPIAADSSEESISGFEIEEVEAEVEEATPKGSSVVEPAGTSGSETQTSEKESTTDPKSPSEDADEPF